MRTDDFVFLSEGLSLPTAGFADRSNCVVLLSKARTFVVANRRRENNHDNLSFDQNVPGAAMKKLICVSKVNGVSPATPIYVNVDLITAVERTPAPGQASAKTSTIWGIEVENGLAPRVAEPVDQVVQMIQEALK